MHSKIIKHFFVITLLLMVFPSTTVNAQIQNSTTQIAQNFTPTPVDQNAVEVRVEEEKKAEVSRFAIIPYRPTYILPAYYDFKPDRNVYKQETPNDEQLKNVELKFQFSLKIPLWTNIFNKPVSLYAAYTQLSFWQAYTDSPFFRESNYEPEFFLDYKVDKNLKYGWELTFIDLGVEHQSNGRGGTLERSWNRMYARAILSKGNFLLSLVPWYVFNDPSKRKHNPDIVHYLGHGKLIFAYGICNNTFSLETRNNIESGFSYGSAQLAWSFPLTKNFKGYIQAFTGYGQSLIEYNHYSNSVGIGFALNDWL